LGVVLIYCRIMIFLLSDKRYPILAHRLIIGFIILIPVCIVVWMRTTVGAGDLWFWIIILVFAVVPAFTYTILFVIQSVVIGWYWLANYVRYHRPYSGDQIRDLLLNPISSGGQEWHFVSMDK